MALSELAFACLVYGGLTNYDESYLGFLKNTGGSVDLGNSDHRKALLTWLNRWGCRHLAHSHHEHASVELLSWHNEYGSTLFPRDRNLWELSEQELTSAGAAYEALSSRIASYRKRNGGRSPVRFGPTAAAKILFAIRPGALLPWDKAIRKSRGYDNSRASYLSFLSSAKSVLEELATSCQRNGFQLADLPRVLGRPHSTVPKLIDEYYWVTITKNCSPPDSDTFQRWASWSRRFANVRNVSPK